jgi:hypothetical protein
MSKLQDFVDEDEKGYKNSLLDIENAISTYGVEILFRALINHVTDHVVAEQESDLTNVVVPDTMLVQ